MEGNRPADAGAEGFRLVPYVVDDGVPSLTDSEIADCFVRMRRDKTDRMVFYDGSITGKDAFVWFAKEPSRVFYVGMIQDDKACCCWLDEITGCSARLHFCVFSDYWGIADELAAKTVEFLFSLESSDDAPLFYVLWGMVPRANDHAVSFAERIGARIAGAIPDAAWLAGPQRRADAMLFYLHREDVR